MIESDVFRQYYDLYYDELCRYLNFYTHDEATIEDVIQNVFLKLWENKSKVDVTYVKTYLFKATHNAIINVLRDDVNRHTLLERWYKLQDTECYQQNMFDINLLMDIVNTAVNDLPDRCKEIFLLSREEELSYNEIAERLDISVKTVETQMSIALKRIRESITSTLAVLILLFME
jgi:RNA polymerase sigma-70 factor (family 1)